MRKQCESGYENLSLKDVERICDRKADKKDFLRGLEMDEIAVKANKFGGGGRRFQNWVCRSDLFDKVRQISAENSFFEKGIFMNRTFKTLWNKARRSYIVANEAQRAHGKSAKGALTLAVVSAALFSTMASAS